MPPLAGGGCRATTGSPTPARWASACVPSTGRGRRWAAGDVAAEPADHRPHHAHLALRDVDGLGAGADVLLQRRLSADARGQADLGAGRARRGRSGRRSGATSARASEPCCAREGDLGRGAAPVPGAQRLPRGDLPHLLVQPAPRRRRARVGGMLCVVTEETERVIGERRLASCATSRPSLATTHTEDEVLAAVAGGWSASRADCPSRSSTSSTPTADGAARASAIGVAAGSQRRAREHRSRRDRRALAGARHRCARGAAHGRASSPGASTRCRWAPGTGLRGRSRWCRIGRQGQDGPPASWWRASTRTGPSTRSIAASSSWSPARSRRALANAHAYEETRRRAEALAELDRAKTAFFKRQPRVPHAADADARPRSRTRSRRRRGRSTGERSRGGAPQRAAAAEAGQHAPRLLAHRGGPRRGRLRAHRSRRPHRRARERLPLGHRARRARLRGRLPAPRGAGLRRPRHVGEDRPQPALERVQVHLRGIDPRGGRADLR